MIIAILVVLIVIAIMLCVAVGILESIDAALRTRPFDRARMPWESDGSTFNVVRAPEGEDS